MSPEIICLGELLVEMMRTEIDIPHGIIGATYKGPYPSGAPAIFIDTVSRLAKPFKFTTGYIGVVGSDEYGECIIKRLQKDGVDISQIRYLDDKTTGIAFNQYNSDGSRKFIFAKGAAGETSPMDVKEKYFEDVKILHIMGSALFISKSSRNACYRAINLAKNKNPHVIISFDPNLRPEMLNLEEILEICLSILEKTEIFLPSGEEAEIIAGVKNPKKACQRLLEMGPKIIALKQGKEGCTIFTSEKSEGIDITGFLATEKDPTGAGDSFDGAFIVGYLAGWDIYKIGLFSNAVGALKVESFGPMAFTSYEEALKLMERD